MITLAWPDLEHIQVMALRLHLIIGLKALSLTGSSTLLWSSRNKLKPRISQKKRKNTSKCESWWLVSPVTSRSLFLMCHHWMSGKKQKSTHLLEGTALLILSFWSTLSLIFATACSFSVSSKIARNHKVDIEISYIQASFRCSCEVSLVGAREDDGWQRACQWIPSVKVERRYCPNA